MNKPFSESLTATSTPQGLNPDNYNLATRALVYFNGTCRVWFDGTDPTSTTGHRFRSQPPRRLNKSEMKHFRVVLDENETAATVTVNYFAD